MSYDLPKFESRITVPVGGWAMTVTDSGGTETYTVPVGSYYPTTLLAAIAAGLTGLGALARTYTATADDDALDASGRVTLAATGTFSVVWGSNALRDLLGFSAGLSGSASYQSPAACKALFLSDVPIAEPMVPDGHPGRLISNATMTVAPSGDSLVLNYGGRRINAWGWRQLSGRKTWSTLRTYVNESLEEWWEYALAVGAPFRYHWDRTDDASYTPWRMVAPVAFPAEPDIAGYVGGPGAEGAKLRWNIPRIDLIRFAG